jgi:hypothetical protein
MSIGQGVAEGWIIPGLGQPPAPGERALVSRTIAEVLAEDRGDSGEQVSGTNP